MRRARAVGLGERVSSVVGVAPRVGALSPVVVSALALALRNGALVMYDDDLRIVYVFTVRHVETRNALAHAGFEWVKRESHWTRAL